jgi:hypothetical protein
MTKRRTITVRPGEQVVIIASANGSETYQRAPIQDQDGRAVLPVPHISQWSPTANRAPGDCGPACIAMVVHYLTDERPTVNEVSVECDVPKGAKWASLSQLARGARNYGLKVYHVRPLTNKRICDEIDAGRPVVALVKYDLLSTIASPNQDKNFKGAHFVLCVGYGHGTVIFHDPDRLSGDEFGEFRETPWRVWDKAAGSTSKTPGNAHNYHGLTFDV